MKSDFVTADLAQLGFERLAELVIEHADEDPALREKLRLALATEVAPREERDEAQATAALPSINLLAWPTERVGLVR